MATVRGVVVIDRGWNRAKQRLQALDGHGVKAGLFDPVLADIGYLNEYGTNKAPARPFMRRSVDAGQNEVRARMMQAARDVAAGAAPAGALAALGGWMEDRIKETIDRSTSWAKPNAPLTVRLKGFDHPLIESGAMRNAVTHKID